MSDYFLIHRALQIQRLCSPETDNGIEIPGRFGRDGLSTNMRELLQCVDGIRKLPLDENSGGGVMKLLRGGGSKTGAALTAKQREQVYNFERRLVELRLLDDPHASNYAAGFIQAILKDQSFFFGLKPLAAHTDDFAYEFLYPTWLNLYTAMRARSGAEKPKFSDEQVDQMFGFVRNLESDSWKSCQPLVGCLTFAANRFNANEALELARRVQRLCSGDSESVATQAERINALVDHSPSAGVLKELMPGYLSVECCMQGEVDERRENATRGEFPKLLENRLRELQQSPDQFKSYRQLLLTIGKIVERAGGFDKVFGQLFATSGYGQLELLDLCLSADNGQPAFSCQAQELVAKVLHLEFKSGQQELRKVRRFAHHLARRTDVLDPDEVRLFTTEFIEKGKNRAVLLACAGDVDKRQRIAEQLLDTVRSESDPDRFFYRLQTAALLGTWQDFEALEKIGTSVKVLQMARRDDSISTRELVDLLDDLRANLPESLDYLASPGWAGREKSDRLAKMYLTLNETCQMYDETGRVGNFGLIRAAYRNLDQQPDE